MPVVGIKERTSGHVRLKALRSVSSRTLADFIRTHTAPYTEVHTDDFTAYVWLDSSEFAHKTVNHSQTYVSGNVHTNGVENVWSLFKRGIMGVFHKVPASICRCISMNLPSGLTIGINSTSWIKSLRRVAKRHQMNKYSEDRKPQKPVSPPKPSPPPDDRDPGRRIKDGGKNGTKK